jgi:hypothetical protein
MYSIIDTGVKALDIRMERIIQISFIFIFLTFLIKIKHQKRMFQDDYFLNQKKLTLTGEIKMKK